MGRLRERLGDHNVEGRRRERVREEDEEKKITRGSGSGVNNRKQQLGEVAVQASVPAEAVVVEDSSGVGVGGGRRRRGTMRGNTGESSKLGTSKIASREEIYMGASAIWKA